MGFMAWGIACWVEYYFSHYPIISQWPPNFGPTLFNTDFILDISLSIVVVPTPKDAAISSRLT